MHLLRNSVLKTNPREDHRNRFLRGMAPHAPPELLQCKIPISYRISCYVSYVLIFYKLLYLNSKASKAAVISFYETLRVEIGSEIGITVVTPGLIESEMTKGKFMFEDGKMYIDQELRDAVMSVMPIEPVGGAVEAMLRAGCRGDEYVTEPPWLRMSFYWKMFLPEVVEWLNYLFIMTGSSPTDTFGKWLLELTGLKPLIYPPSVRSPELGIQIGVYPNI